jgi:hypothetical protein
VLLTTASISHFLVEGMAQQGPSGDILRLLIKPHISKLKNI